jgi:hypothetical protein
MRPRAARKQAPARDLADALRRLAAQTRDPRIRAWLLALAGGEAAGGKVPAARPAPAK